MNRKTPIHNLEKVVTGKNLLQMKPLIKMQ